MGYLKLLLILGFLFRPMEFTLAEDNARLPEVVVEESAEGNYLAPDASSALKSPLSVFDTPRSVTIINQNSLEDQRTLRLQETLLSVSGAVPGDSGSSLTPYLLRGFRAEVLRNGFAQSRFLFYNIFQEEIANVERVEVLKGATSALYGNTGAGGAINVITKKPLPYFYASAALDFGDFGLIRPSIDISVPLASTLFARLTASLEDSESFRDFIRSKRAIVAPVATWRILPGMTLTVEAEYLYADEPFDTGITAVGDSVADIPRSRNLAEASDRDTSRRAILEATLLTDFSESLSMKNALRYNRSRAEQFNHTPAFLLPDDRTLSRFIVDLDFTSRIYSTRHEVRLKSEINSVSNVFVIGGEYSREKFTTLARTASASDIDIFAPEYGNIAPFDDSAPPAFNLRGELDSLALYAENQTALPYGIRLVAGGRLDFYDEDIRNRAGTQFGEFAGEERGKEFSPQIGLTYQPARWISVYSSYGESFNFLFSSGLKPDGSILAPETSKQYEAGVKLNLPERGIASTLSVYRIDARNTPVTDPVNGPLFSVQVARQRSEGIELDFTAEPVAGLNLIASYAYTDAGVIEDDFFEPGSDAPASPRHSAAFWAAYRIEAGALRGAGFGAGFFAAEGRDGDLQNTFRLDDFIRFDAAIYYSRIVGGFRADASVNFKNITDERYVENSGSRLNVNPGAPFSVLAGLRVRLGD